MNLKPEVKRQWIDALESGEFIQGRNNLRSVDAEGNFSHCCLGVLCEVALRNGVEGTWENRTLENGLRPAKGVSVFITPSIDETDPDFEYNQDVFLLPDSVVEWSGLGINSPLLPEKFTNPEENLISLANLNDRSNDFSAVIEVIKTL